MFQVRNTGNYSFRMPGRIGLGHSLSFLLGINELTDFSNVKTKEK